MSVGAPTHVTKGQDNTDSQSYTTASITPSSGDTLYMLIGTEKAAGAAALAATPTSSHGTWSPVSGALVQWGGSSRYRMEVFQCVNASAVAGAVSIAVAGSANIGCEWWIIKVNNGNTVVKVATNTASAATSLSIPASPRANAGVGIAFFAHDVNDASLAVSGTGWSQAATSQGHGSPAISTQSGLSSGSNNDPSSDCSALTAGLWAGISLEIIEIVPVTGTAASAFGFATAATGDFTPARTGTAASAFGFSTSGTGTYTSVPITGTSDAAFGFSTSGSGSETFSGAAASAFGFAASGLGESSTVAGTGASAFGFASAGTGEWGLSGSAASAFGFAASGGVGAVFLPPPSPPTLGVYMDLGGDGVFGVGDDVTPYIVTRSGVSWERGRSADFSNDVIGQSEFTLKNEDGFWTTALEVGMPVQVRSTYLGVTRYHFFGYVQRWSPDAWAKTVKVTCYDPFKQLSNDQVSVGGDDIARSARELRVAVLEQHERGAANLVGNPSFETNTVGWSVTAGALTRITTQAAPGGGVASGQFVASAGGQRMYYSAKLEAQFSGTYQTTLYLKSASGTQSWIIYIFNPLDLQTSFRVVTVTTSWTRVAISIAMQSAVTPKDGGLQINIQSQAAGTIYVDNVAMTKGAAVYPYTATAGRWPNMVGASGFDGMDITGWGGAWTNLIANPSAETNTSGWSAAGDAFTTTGGTLSRVTSAGNFKYGSAAFRLVTGSGVFGAFYDVTGTFLAGVEYTLQMDVKASVAGDVIIGIGSQGTPADAVSTTRAETNVFFKRLVKWTPSSNRTDVHVHVSYSSGGGNLYWDGVILARYPAFLDEEAATTYTDAGPAGGGSIPTTIDTSTSGAVYGSRALRVVTPATSGAGVVYDFAWNSMIFQAGVAYSLSLWLDVAAGTFPYKVALSAPDGNGGWDEQTATGTVTAGVPQRVTLSWTPAADTTVDPGGAWISITQTNATARTFYVDGVRVVPGAVDDYEMSHWNIPQDAEDDVMKVGASLRGSALDALNVVNGLMSSRHWVSAVADPPYWQYNVDDRDAASSRVVADTFVNDFAGFEDLDIDGDSVVNVVGVGIDSSFTANDTVYYSDEDSVDAYGASEPYVISGSSFLSGTTVADEVAAAILAQHKDPRARPRMTITPGSKAEIADRYLSILSRDLNDLIVATLDSENISAREYVIVRNRVQVSGIVWSAEWGLEEYAF